MESFTDCPKPLQSIQHFTTSSCKITQNNYVKLTAKYIVLTCMGLSLERLLKSKDNTCSPQWKHVERQNCTSWLDIQCTIKEYNLPCFDQFYSLSFEIGIIYVVSFFPASLMWEVQTIKDTSVGGALQHKRRIFRRETNLILAPSPNYPRPNISLSWRRFAIFCHTSPESLNSTTQLHCMR